MTTFTEASLASFNRAVEAGRELRNISLRHELLRFVKEGTHAEMERLNEERVERFYNGTPEELERLPVSEIDRITFDALANAMYETLKEKGHPALTVDIKRIMLHTDPAVTLFNVVIESVFPEGVYTHTAPSKEHLDVFLEGFRAATASLGLYVRIPDVPPEWRVQNAYLEVKEPEPEPSEREIEDIPL